MTKKLDTLKKIPSPTLLCDRTPPLALPSVEPDRTGGFAEEIPGTLALLFPAASKFSVSVFFLAFRAAFSAVNRGKKRKKDFVAVPANVSVQLGSWAWRPRCFEPRLMPPRLPKFHTSYIV